MLTRRGFAGCALCAATGFAAAKGFLAVAASADTLAAPTGLQRIILRRSDGPTPDYETILAVAMVEPHVLVPRHIHPGIESAYIAEGEATFQIDGEPPVALKAGDGVHVPARRVHFLQNGDRPLKIVSTYILEKGQPLAIPV
jgi:quercetin dioxygenase-like cupin family protein